MLDNLSTFAVQHCIPPYICQTPILLLAFCWSAEGRGAENLVHELNVDMSSSGGYSKVIKEGVGEGSPALQVAVSSQIVV